MDNNNYDMSKKIKNEREELYRKILDEIRGQVSQNENNNNNLEVVIQNWKEEKKKLYKRNR